MATTKEKQDLIEVIKRPIRYYRITLVGYGGESAYIELTKTQYDYWETKDKESHDSTLDYMLDDYSSRDGAPVSVVPQEADFMNDPNDPVSDFRYPWYDAPTLLTHHYGVDYNSAKISITEIESDAYDAKELEDVVLCNTNLETWINDSGAEWDNSGEIDAAQSKYMLHFHSSEKGTFFEGVFTTVGKFNPAKLKIHSTEQWNGDDTIDGISYNGESIENLGGDTNHKGYSVYMWTNVLY